MRYIDRLHPISAFVYFVAMLALAMLTMDPFIISICYVSGIMLKALLVGIRKLLAGLAYSIPLMILLALTNPIFSHQGATVFFHLGKIPITKEAIVYGLFASMMIMSVFYWFSCYSVVITSDKFLYLFGRVVPKLSLVLSMTLAFVPKLKRKWREIDDSQKALGMYASKNYSDKVKSKMRALSVLLASSLEDSIDTSDSMRARGYGLRGRSCYTVYKFTFSDVLFLLFTIAFSVTTIILVMLGAAEFSYYPTLSYTVSGGISYIMYIALAILAASSIIMEVKDNILWHYLKSKI